MRQHVNPLSSNFHEIEIIPPLNEIFYNPNLPLHVDVGSASGNFLFDIALENNSWNYIGIDIREKLINNAKTKLSSIKSQNLYFVFGNANNIFNDSRCKFLISDLKSISFYFPDPWFKKKHYKRRVIQPELINLLSKTMQKESYIFIKTDVEELFNHMDLTISSNSAFGKLDANDFNYHGSFNPNRIQTNREKYVASKKFKIYQSIYVKT